VNHSRFAFEQRALPLVVQATGEYLFLKTPPEDRRPELDEKVVEFLVIVLCPKNSRKVREFLSSRVTWLNSLQESGH